MKVSVVVPAYNEAKHIFQAVRSLLNQTLQEIEIVVVDDHSTDATREIVLGIDDPRVRLLRNGENQGVVSSLNRGIAESRAEFVARMDADDASLPERLEKQWLLMRDAPSCVVTGTGIFFLDYRKGEFRRIVPATGDSASRRSLLTHSPINAGSAMFRRSALERVGGFTESETRAENFELLLKLSQVGTLNNVPDAEYLYFIRGTGQNRSGDQGSRPRNQAMASMTRRAGQLSDSRVVPWLASVTWRIYHLLPRPVQVMLRNRVSDKENVDLTPEEVKRLESFYEALE